MVVKSGLCYGGPVTSNVNKEGLNAGQNLVILYFFNDWNFSVPVYNLSGTFHVFPEVYLLHPFYQ